MTGQASYAARTGVPVDRTLNQIRTMLLRHGATGWGFIDHGARVAIFFEIGGRRVRLDVRLPERGERRFTHTPAGRERTASSAASEYEMAVRARWRALHAIIKAKVIAIDAGVSTLEEEFLYAIMLPDQSTVGQWLRPQLEQALTTGRMPPMLPGGSDPAGSPAIGS